MLRTHGSFEARQNTKDSQLNLSGSRLKRFKRLGLWPHIINVEIAISNMPKENELHILGSLRHLNFEHRNKITQLIDSERDVILSNMTMISDAFRDVFPQTP